MNFYNLTVFCKVVELGSISLVAKELLTTSSAVSQHIREIERNFGVHITERAGRGIKITQPGIEIYEYSKAVLDRESELKEKLPRMEKILPQSISVGITILLKNILSQPLLITNPSYKSINLNVRQYSSVETCNYVAKKKLEFGIVTSHTVEQVLARSKKIKAETFLSIPLVIVCSTSSHLANHEFTRKELENKTFVMATQKKLTNHIRQKELHFLNNTVEIEDIKTIKMAVMNGKKLLGILCYPDVKDEIERGLLSVVQISDYKFDRNFSIIYREEHQEFTHLIKNVLKESVPKNYLYSATS